MTISQSRRLLRLAWLDVCNRFPFSTVAVVLLPDHLHCIWSLPEEDANYSIRWGEIKRVFTRGYLTAIGPEEERNPSRVNREEATIWQRRFWEHTIRDEEDMNRHIDYIHFNPVKHGLVRQASEWAWSSFQQHVRMGYYEPDWGQANVPFNRNLLYWEKRLTGAQNRLLRAIETLARVRKLTSPLVQLNIAQEGGQQVNVAGDLNR